MDAATATGLIAGAVVIYFVTRFVGAPIKALVRLVVNTALGVLAFYAWDRWVATSHWAIGINPYTAGAVGFLGASGFVLVVALRFLLP